MIRVLCVTTKLCPGGVQTFLVSYARELIEYGIWLDFVVQTTETQLYDQELLSMGCRIYSVCPYNKSKYQFLKEIYKILKNNKEYRIIHTHLNFINALPLFAAYLAKCPVRISHSHSNYEPSGIKAKIARYFAKAIIKLFATNFWACSQQSAIWIYEKLNDVQIIKNGVNYDKYCFDLISRDNYRKNLGISNSDFVWIHVGTYSEVKNQCFILYLLKEYLSINSNVKLLLCGDGELRNKINQTIDELGLQKYVIQLGSKNNVNDYLNAADLFVFPSHFEGLPFALIEAQTSGLPVVVSKAISDEALFGNFFKCNTFDISEWVQNIQDAFLCDRYLDKEKFYNSGFSLKHEAEILSQLYKSLI